jgi:hypothetical protein
MERRGNTLSALLRLAWDGDNLRVLSRFARQATEPHISLIAHITRPELRRLLSRDAILNGFANRFLWLRVERSKFLPYGGVLPAECLAPLCARLAETVAFARTVGRMHRDDNAEIIWHGEYQKLAADDGGMVAALTGRAEAQVLRLSCLYALLDRSAVVTPAHLCTAMSLWDLCRDSVESLFGDGLDDPIANRILDELRRHPDTGITQTQLYNLFYRKVPSYRLRLATDRLLRDRLAIFEVRTGPGRSSLVWTLADPEWTKTAKPDPW